MALVIRALPSPPLYLHRLLTNFLVHGLPVPALFHFYLAL